MRTIGKFQESHTMQDIFYCRSQHIRVDLPKVKRYSILQRCDIGDMFLIKTPLRNRHNKKSQGLRWGISKAKP